MNVTLQKDHAPRTNPIARVTIVAGVVRALYFPTKPEVTAIYFPVDGSFSTSRLSTNLSTWGTDDVHPGDRIIIDF